MVWLMYSPVTPVYSLSNPPVPITLNTKLPKQFYVQFPPWTNWRPRPGFRLGFPLLLPYNFPKG